MEAFQERFGDGKSEVVLCFQSGFSFGGSKGSKTNTWDDFFKLHFYIWLIYIFFWAKRKTDTSQKLR